MPTLNINKVNIGDVLIYYDKYSGKRLEYEVMSKDFEREEVIVKRVDTGLLIPAINIGNFSAIKERNWRKIIENAQH